MTEITQKDIDDFKRIYKKEYNKDITDDEAREAAYNLVGFAEIIYKQIVRDHHLKQKLTKEPNGFHFDDNKFYTCCICSTSISNKEIWYDQNGIKCIPCQKALDTKVIPKYICTKPDSWLSDWKVQDKLKIHSATMRKMIRENKLKPRVINREDGSKHFELFIIKENPFLLEKLPPIDRKTTKRDNVVKE